MRSKAEFDRDVAKTAAFLDAFVGAKDWPPLSQRIALAKRLIALGWILLDVREDGQP
ncbi:MAG: hypothetical protein OXJ64_05175 [Boseongicola sp.]|nr:hypothetical protein [Boseongicola sp.]